VALIVFPDRDRDQDPGAYKLPKSSQRSRHGTCK
jgi:hypothetical protein